MGGDWQTAAAAAELRNSRFAVAPLATPAGVDVKSGIPFQPRVLRKGMAPFTLGVLKSREALQDPDQLVVSGTRGIS
jgi:hypothetical protein